MDHTVSDSLPLSSTSSLPPRATAVRRPRALIRGAALLACLDGLAAVAAIGAVLVGLNLPQFSSLDSFLSVRITVKNIVLLMFLATAWPVLFHLFRLYDAQRVHNPLGLEAPRLATATFVGSGLAFVFPLTSGPGSLTIADLRYFWLASFSFCFLGRAVWQLVDRARHPEVKRALIVGTGAIAARLSRDIRRERSPRYEVVGFIDDSFDHPVKSGRVQHEPVGTLLELEQILMQQVIDEVVIALPVKSCYQQIQHVIGVCERAGVQSKYGADLFESTVASPRYDAQGDRAFVAMQVAPDDYRLVIKRAIDIVGAVVGLVVLAPVLLVVAAAIKLTSSGPIVYTQKRCGLNKRPFRMFKFRSMVADAERLQASLEERNEARGPVFKIKNDPRVTPLGRQLRKWSLDELPQFWNVLRGDMSLVGPRPLPPRDVGRITRPSDMRRFSMRPGLTCLWQVQGRSTLDFERWVELDLQYIDNWSLALDLRILIRTIPAVLSGNGAT